MSHIRIHNDSLFLPWQHRLPIQFDFIRFLILREEVFGLVIIHFQVVFIQLLHIILGCWLQPLQSVLCVLDVLQSEGRFLQQLVWVSEFLSWEVEDALELVLEVKLVVLPLTLGVALGSDALSKFQCICAGNDCLLGRRSDASTRHVDYSFVVSIVVQTVFIFFGLEFEYCLVEHLESHFDAFLQLRIACELL
jgi:hypothetical protein